MFNAPIDLPVPTTPQIWVQGTISRDEKSTLSTKYTVTQLTNEKNLPKYANDDTVN